MYLQNTSTKQIYKLQQSISILHQAHLPSTATVDEHHQQFPRLMPSHKRSPAESPTTFNELPLDPQQMYSHIQVHNFQEVCESIMQCPAASLLLRLRLRLRACNVRRYTSSSRAPSPQATNHAMTMGKLYNLMVAPVQEMIGIQACTHTIGSALAASHTTSCVACIP